MIASIFDRRDYPTLEQYRYLNQASLGLMGRPAVDAMHAFIDDVARHGNGSMSDEDEAGYLESLRTAGAELLGCPASQVAVIGGASEVLAQLPMMLEPAGEKSILAVATDFPAVTRPWLRLQNLGGCRVRFVEDSPSRNLTEALVDAIDADTAVVAVSSVQFATGTTVDVDAVSQAACSADARLVVDVTQELGARRVDAGRWDADAVVCSGYKWLGGHGGVALAAMSPRLLEHPPPMTGWMGAPEPFDFDAMSVPMADDARRYTQSTMSYASVAGLTAAIRALLAAGAERIEAHSGQLARLLIEGAERKGWRPWRPLDDSSSASHVVSLAHEEKPAKRAMAALAGVNVVCSSRGGRIRVSLAPYNDETDVGAFVRAL